MYLFADQYRAYWSGFAIKSCWISTYIYKYKIYLHCFRQTNWTMWRSIMEFTTFSFTIPADPWTIHWRPSAAAANTFNIGYIGWLRATNIAWSTTSHHILPPFHLSLEKQRMGQNACKSKWMDSHFQETMAKQSAMTAKKTSKNQAAGGGGNGDCLRVIELLLATFKKLNPSPSNVFYKLWCPTTM